MKKILAALVMFPALAFGQYTGFSAYAGMNKGFPCGRFLEVSRYADKPIMAVLYSTFGKDASCIKRFVNRFKDKLHAVEFHLNNETCRRGGRVCYEQEILGKLSPGQYSHALQKMPNDLRNRIQRRVSDIRKITESGNTNTRFLLSLGLEDQYTSEAAASIFDVVKKEWPYEIVRNPAAERSDDKNADIIELHSDKSKFPDPKRCIWNQDGLDGGVAQARKQFAMHGQCMARIAWTKEAQGIKEVFVPPLKRKFVISKKDVKEYGSLLRRSNTDN